MTRFRIDRPPAYPADPALAALVVFVLTFFAGLVLGLLVGVLLT